MDNETELELPAQPEVQTTPMIKVKYLPPLFMAKKDFIRATKRRTAVPDEIEWELLSEAEQQALLKYAEKKKK